VVDEEMLGVVKFVPVPREVPPVKAEYQFIVPAEAVADKFTGPDPQLLPGKTPVIVGRPIKMFDPLSLPVTAGLLEITLIR
jgi:hypothetical protein